jgi:hypothetical protein
MVLTHAYHVHKTLRVFATEGEYATTGTSVAVTVIARLAGMGRIATNVHLPFKADSAINANVAGTDRDATNVTRAIVALTVISARRDGSQRQIV